MVKIKTLLLITVLSSVLSACASSVRTGSIPEQGLTVEQIYAQVTGKHSDELNQVRQRVRGAKESHRYEGYTRTALNETKAMFKPIENPAVPIYIFPHLVQVGDEQLVKPGFTTQFFLFKRNQFALNSERY